MAVNTISAALAGLYGTSGSGSTSSTGTTNPAAQALLKADKRITQQRTQASVQLSAFGKLKLAYSGVQGAASALENLTSTSSTADVRKAAGAFVTSYNGAIDAARSATGQQAVPVEANRARSAETDLRRSFVADEATTAALRSIGIRQEASGKLSIDNQAFEAALASNPEAVRTALVVAGADRGTLSTALGTVGRQVDAAATRELADSGNVGKAVNALTDRAKVLEARQTEQQRLAAAAQQTVEAQSTQLNNAINSGAAAYQRIFSL